MCLGNLSIDFGGKSLRIFGTTVSHLQILQTNSKYFFLKQFSIVMSSKMLLV